MWVTYGILSAVSAAMVAIFAKLGLKEVDPTLATTIRSIIMAAFLVIVSAVLKKFNNFSSSGFGGKEWALIAMAGISGAVSWIFYFLALKYGPASKVAVIDRMSFVLVIVFAALFLGEALSWKVALGGLVMIAGVLIILL